MRLLRILTAFCCWKFGEVWIEGYNPAIVILEAIATMERRRRVVASAIARVRIVVDMC